MSLSQQQLDAVAKCAVAGMAQKEIASYARCSIQKVNQLLKGGEDENFDRLYEGWQQKSLGVIVDHRFRLQEYLELAYQVTGETLRQDKDLRLRWEAAQWLISGLSGFGRAAAPVSFNLGVQTNIAAEQQVNTAITEIGGVLQSLMTTLAESRSTAGADPHEKIGDEALPASYKLVGETEGVSLGAKPNGKDAEPVGPPEGTPVTKPQ